MGAVDSLAPTTARNYRNYLDRHLFPAFASTPITEITRQNIRAFAKDTLERVSFKTLKDILIPLRSTLEEAVEDGLLPSNPARHLNLRQRTKGKRERQINPLNSVEVSTLLEAVRTNFAGYHPLFLCATFTGMRLGEIRGLEWGDINFGRDDEDTGRYIHVQRSFVRGRFSTPKSGRTRRVDLSTALRAAFIAHQMDGYTKGRGQSEDLVFYGKEGGPVGERTIQKVLKKALALAGLRDVRFHDLRHSYATILLYEMGAPIQYVSNQLGHSSIMVTVDVYGHPEQGTNIALADGLSKQLSATYVQPKSASVWPLLRSNQMRGEFFPTPPVWILMAAR